MDARERLIRILRGSERPLLYSEVVVAYFGRLPLTSASYKTMNTLLETMEAEGSIERLVAMSPDGYYAWRVHILAELAAL